MAVRDQMALQWGMLVAGISLACGLRHTELTMVAPLSDGA